MGAKHAVVIEVSDKHIELGLPENSARCMIAEAIKDAIPTASKVHVDMQTMRYTDAKGIRRTYLTPGSAQAALIRFDAGDPVEPFRFKLNHAMHISRIRTGDEKRQKQAVLDTSHPRPRVGGRQVPIMGNPTRRKFGIRGLRINQQGQIVQTNVIETAPR